MSTSSPAPQQTKTDDAEGNIEMKSNCPEKKDKGKRSKKQRQLDEQNTIWMGEKVRDFLLHQLTSSSFSHMNGKVIADVVEAILAAAFLSGGHEVALQAARQLQVPIPNIAQWSDYARLSAQHAAPAQPTMPPVALPSTTVEAIELVLDSRFGRPDLLGQALVSLQPF